MTALAFATAWTAVRPHAVPIGGKPKPMEASGRRDGEEQVSASEASSHGPGAGALHHEEPGGWHLSSKHLAFLEDPLLAVMLAAKGVRGISSRVKAQAQIEAKENAKKLEAEGKQLEAARALLGPRGGLPTLRRDLLQLAALVHVEVGEKDTVEMIKQKIRPVVQSIMVGSSGSSSKDKVEKSAAKAASLTKTTGDGHRDACGDGGGIDGRPEQCGDPGGGGRDVVATRREVPGHDVPGDADGHDHAREPDDWTPRFGRGHGDRVREFTRWSDATNRVGAVHPRRSVPSQLRVLPGAAPSENGDGRSLGQPHGDGGGSGDLGEGLRRSSGEEVNPWMVHQELKKGIATMVSQAWQQHERDRRLVSRSAKEVLEVMQTQWEQDIEKGLNETFMTAIRFGDKDNPLVSEIYTNTQRVMKEASRRGHAVGTAMSLETGWNFLKEEDRKRAFQKVKEEKPYFLVLAFPCRPWSPLMNLNPALDLPQRRAEGLELIRFALDLAKLQASAGRHYLLENPLTSAAWKLEEVQKFLEEMDCYVADFHQCRFGLKGSTGKLHRKATRMVSSSKVLLWVLSRNLAGYKSFYNRSYNWLT